MATLDPPQPFRVPRRVIADPSGYLEDLLMYIDEGRVIPIIGPELVLVCHGDQEVPLYDFLAHRLAEQFQLKDLTGDFTLQDVVTVYTQNGGAIERIYPRILSILSGQRFTPPPALLRLASIPRFRLFVTTTFDSMLTQAVNQARFGGDDRTKQVVYAGTRLRGGDLEDGWESGSDPIVFHLLGRASAAPNYVATEEDTLEFLYKLQADAPHMKLFDELTTKHLLILGCSFPDWLARFFIRLAKRVPLSLKRYEMELVADSFSRTDTHLTLFLDNFSYSTRMFPGTAAEFVDLLVDGWDQRYGKEAPVPQPQPPATGMPPGAVLISYASEDRAYAEHLRVALGTLTDVWLDQEQLIAGDDWDLKIRRSIGRCSLFVPVLSRRAAKRAEGYFRHEWTAALHRRNGISADLPFIVPVVIDDLPEAAEGVPERFWAPQVTRMVDGQLPAEFLPEVEAQLMKVRTATRSAP